MPWLLDVVFTLAERLPPYNKYLPWEMREHPLALPEWSAETFLPELERILAGDADALRRTFAVVDREVRAWDAGHDLTICGDIVDEWGPESALFGPPRLSERGLGRWVRGLRRRASAVSKPRTEIPSAREHLGIRHALERVTEVEPIWLKDFVSSALRRQDGAENHSRPAGWTSRTIGR
ncbi:MAG: hypothetical protein WAV00_14340 [Nocardioides sp.]